MSMTSLAANWGGGGFVLIPQPGSTSKVDFTAITDEYRFHMAIKKSTASPCIINVAGGGDPDGKVDLGQTAHFTVGANENVWPDNSPPNLTPDFVVNQWQIIDIPITELKDLGWSNRGTFSGGGQYYLSWDLGPVNGNK